MNKKPTIRLNESQLRRIVSESVKNILKEDSGKESVINALRDAEQLLRSVYPTLVELNRDGQFDYVTSGNLGDVVGNIEEIVKRIGKIVWQN